MCHHHTSVARKRPRSSSLGGHTSNDKENSGSSTLVPRADSIKDQSGKLAAAKRQRSRASPTAVDDQADDAPAVDSETEDSDTDEDYEDEDDEDEDDEDEDDEDEATAEHRDEIVVALLTITSALALSKETLHVCVNLLDRYLERCGVEVSRLEALSIACLWIAVKFVETPVTIAHNNIKQTLQRRRLSGNWAWSEVLDFERAVLQALNYRVMAPTVLSLLQRQLYSDSDSNMDNNNSSIRGDSVGQAATTMSPKQRHLALYFADLLLLTSRASAHSSDTLAAAAVFAASGRRVQDAPPSLLEPVLLLFVAHRDTINPAHPGFKARFALRCQYGTRLHAPWRVPFDPRCSCRVCERVVDERETASV